MKFKIIILQLILISCNSLYAWENKKTHPALTDNGIAASTINGYLKTQMGLANGVSTQLNWNFPQDIKTRIGMGIPLPIVKTKTWGF